MKQLRFTQKKFQFEMDRTEKFLLFHVLKLYPAVPASHHRLSKDRHISNRDENQHLLDEALKAQRIEQRKQVESLLKDPHRFVAFEDGYRISFTRDEIEWLLQVLNDVRVGSWIAIGSPDLQMENKKRLAKQAIPHLMAMDAAGFFETNFLHALTGGAQPGHE
jgi:hypothetical protein